MTDAFSDDVSLPSPLEVLRETLAERKRAGARREVLRDTLARPDLALTVRIPQSSAEMLDVTKRADKADSDERRRRQRAHEDQLPDTLVFAAMMVARFTEQVTLNGKPLTPGDGNAFAWPALQEAVGAASAWDCVVKVFDDDFAVMRIADKITKEAGMGRDGVVVGEVSDDADPM